MKDLNPLVSEGSEPALFVLGLLGAQQVDLVARHRPQLQGILDGDVEVLLLAVLHVYYLHVVHVHPTLVVQHVPAQEVLQWQGRQRHRVTNCDTSALLFGDELTEVLKLWGTFLQYTI